MSIRRRISIATFPSLKSSTFPLQLSLSPPQQQSFPCGICLDMQNADLSSSSINQKTYAITIDFLPLICFAVNCARPKMPLNELRRRFWAKKVFENRLSIEKSLQWRESKKISNSEMLFGLEPEKSRRKSMKIFVSHAARHPVSCQNFLGSSHYVN